MQRIDTGIGHIPEQPFKPNSDGKFDDADVTRAILSIVTIASLLNGHLRIGTGEANTQAGNLDGLFLKIVFGPKDTEVKLPHDLGRPPVAFLACFKDRACDVYSMRGAAEVWGDGTIAYFACSVDNAKVIGLLL